MLRQLKAQYFNSIKVRLKLNPFLGDISASQVFQFHKGTIKTKKNLKPLFVTLQYFNSIKVRLKHYDGSETTDQFIDFNSIKVRLKR